VVAAPAHTSLAVVLKNRAPRGAYHVAVEPVLSADNQPEKRAIRLRGASDVPMTEVAAPKQFSLWPECNELQQRAAQVLLATEESQLPERLKAVAEKNRSGVCMRLSSAFVESSLRAGLDTVVKHMLLFPGDEVRFSVERRDPRTQSPLKSWVFLVQSPRLRPPWPYANEEAYIVTETARDLAEMAFYAREGSRPGEQDLALSAVPEAAPGDSVPRYAVSLTALGQAEKHALSFAEHIWSPGAYEPLAARLLEAFGLRPARASDAASVLPALLTPRSSVLERESQRVSNRLRTTMLDAGAHEQAALILGSLALREAAGLWPYGAAGGFQDTRHTLCRMAAHLALARALRAREGSRSAAYAEALLLTLVNREQDALDGIAAIEKTGLAPPATAFLRALRIRNTHDWRILKRPARASLLERLEHYRAVRVSLGSNHAMAFLDSQPPEPMSDWGRIALERPTVEQGNVFRSSLLAIEIDEALRTWEAFHGQSLSALELAEKLNARPERLIVTDTDGKATPRVIGWGVWARFFQRNLCFEAEAVTTFLHEYLRLEDEARELRTALSEKMKTLELWPLIAQEWASMVAEKEPLMEGDKEARDRLRRESCTRIAALMEGAPEQLTAERWSRLSSACLEEMKAQKLPRASEWFTKAVPAGTALLDRGRMLLERSKNAPVDHTALRKLAPFDKYLVGSQTPRSEDPSVEELVALYGPLTEYDLSVMRSMARAVRHDPAAARARYARLAAIDPDTYLQLGNYLVDLDLEEEAAAAYEKAIEKARDRVALSNGLLWLVGYYCDRGQLARARAVAQEAADVYSGSGLQTMAYFLERLGQYDEAEKWYLRIFERYNDRRDLDSFYVRYEQRRSDGRFSGPAAAARARLFPTGLERVSFAGLKPPPPRNPKEVMISGEFPRSTRFGLVKDDLVIALNGYRVRNNEQYQCVWTFDDGPEATVIAWRRDRFVEIKGIMKRVRYQPVR
jgi:tetratricopeptide (TPR) repeat protein